MTLRVMQDAVPLPGYRLIERLGRGGYGEVWKAEAPGGLFKAIKFVYGDLESSGDDSRAAEQELKALNRVKTIRHPFILTIERFDIIEGQLMIVMELADRNLWDRFHECRTQGLPGLPREELMRYMDECAEALDLMNSHYQIQHLDIKPQNLFLVHNHVKVADFGLAKDFEGIRATVTGGVTPVYAAPETFEGWISRFCDQYSLAIVYQELLTGVRPFSGTNTRHLLMQHISAKPDVSPLPPHEREVVARALSKKPDDRYPMCCDFVKALRDSPTAPTKSVSVAVSMPVDAPLETSRTVPNFKPNKAGDTASVQPLPTPADSAQSLKPLLLKGLPKLITPGSAASAASAARVLSPLPAAAPSNITLQRPAAFETGRISRIGLAPAEKIGAGVLFPVYVVAAGKIGLQVMQRLRSYLHERFHRGTFPHWKWLFVDTDGETIQTATGADKHEALDSGEVYHARMHRPAHYLKREGLPPPDTWMSNELLYRMPHEPATDGIRSLGRLALLDHYPALSQKIRQDLETFLSDNVLAEADQQTRLGIRLNRPRVYFASSLSGGTGSGMLLDLAYIIRHEMRQMGFTKPQLTGLLHVPPVDRTSPKSLSIANTCVALAELQHCSLPATRYEARYDTRQPSIADPDRPFERCVLLSLPRTPSQHAPPSADRAAGLIYQEALTPIGRRIDEARSAFQSKYPPSDLPLQSFDCFRITWPRQRLLDTVSERLAARTVEQWASKDVAPIRQPVADWLEDQWNQARFDPDALAATLRAAMGESLKNEPEAVIDAEFKHLPLEAAAAGNADLPDIITVIDRILQIVGRPGDAEEFMPGEMARVLEIVAKPITRESEVKFAKLAVHFVEQPHFRLAGAEEAIRLCTERMRALIDERERLCQQLAKELEEEYTRLVPLIGSLSHSSFFKAASRRAHAVAELSSWLHNWPRKRLRFLLSRCIASIYRQMLGNAPEYLREIAVSRHKLSEVSVQLHKLAEVSADLGPSQDHPILPLGCKTLIEAADRFIGNLNDADRLEFEETLQKQIRRHMRALVNVCSTMNENAPRFKEIVLGQARAFVDARLGQHTPAEEFFRNRPDTQAAHREILLAFDESTPEPFGPCPSREAQSLFLGIMSDEYGKRFKEMTKELIQDLEPIDATSTSEIVFFREYHNLQFSEISQAGPIACEAVREVKSRDKINPHIRTDVPWSSFLRE